jgi:hypothetical protein
VLLQEQEEQGRENGEASWYEGLVGKVSGKRARVAGYVGRLPVHTLFTLTLPSLALRPICVSLGISIDRHLARRQRQRQQSEKHWDLFIIVYTWSDSIRSLQPTITSPVQPRYCSLGLG